MSAFDNARKFFEACDAAAGWDACKDYVADGASFEAQSEPIADINTVQAYCDWMHAFGTVTVPGCSYTLHTSGYDEDTNTAMFFATFHGTHSGDGGPVPPTNQQTNTHYVYFLTMSDDDKVKKMVKVWNAPWAMKELGWM